MEINACDRKGILRAHTVAKRLGLSVRMVRHLAVTHKLKAEKTGCKLWGFDPADVEAYATRRRYSDDRCFGRS
jgi:excisionase family DNA binding protein